MNTQEQARAREAIVWAGRSLYSRGYLHGTTGNISVKLSDGHLLITPTDACLGELSPDTLALLDAQGQQISGERASKTISLHRHIYAADPGAACVIHTHSRALVQLSLQGVWRHDCVLPPITPYQVMKVGRVPLIAYQRPGDPVVAQSIAEQIHLAAHAQRPLRAVLVDRLGPNVWQSSVPACMAVLEELEETARLWLACDPKPAALTPAQLAQLQASFGAVW